MTDKPAFIDPEQAAEAHAILARPRGVPQGRQDLSDSMPVHREVISPSPNRLGPEQAWFMPGLAYCMIGVNTSLFELYAQQIGRSVAVTTYRTPRPLATFTGADVTENPWFHTIQGVSRDERGSFIDFVESFCFRDGVKLLDWCVSAVPLRIRDPFITGNLLGMDCTILCPTCTTTGRVVLPVNQFNVTLEAPELCVVKTKLKPQTDQGLA